MIVFMRTGGVWVRLCDPAYEPLRSCHILCLRQGVSMRKPEPLIPWRRLEGLRAGWRWLWGSKRLQIIDAFAIIADPDVSR